MRRAYQSLLRLYPYDYRAMFAAEMIAAFDEATQERPAARVAELIGLLIGAAAEWIAKLTSSPSIRGRSLPDLRMMRPPGVTKEAWFLTRSGKCSSDISR